MAALTAQQVVKLEDGEFDSKIKDMSVKNLIDTITVLQKEMSKEQENFNSLSTELGVLKRNSGQYKSISKDMTVSQTRLTLLMNRSMKCFSQQGNQQSKAAVERRNSFQERQSKGHVQNRASEPVKSAAVTQSVKTEDQSKRHSDIGTGNRMAVQVQSLKSNSPVLRSKSNDINNSLGNINGEPRKSLPLSLNKNNETANKSHLENRVNDNSGVNGQQRTASVSNSGASLGPMAEQRNKYLSKSSDNVFKKPSETAPHKAEVVKGITAKPVSRVVMNADKQMMDLDSFTDRKNMMDELKKFDKTLKPSVGRTQVTEVKVNVAKNGEKRTSANMEPKGSVTPVEQKVNILGDIKLGKKPSELKQTKNVKTEQNGNDREKKATREPVKVEIDYPRASQNDSQSQMFDDLLKDVDSDKSEQSSEDSPRETIVVPEQNQAISTISTTEKKIISSDIGRRSGDIPASGEITIEEARANIPAIETSDDSLSQSSGMSEDDDKFVTEFHFSGSQIKGPSVEAAIPKKQDRFASGISQHGQPITEMVNARLRRIQELERVRQEHASEILPSAGDSASRHSRRDRFIRQSGQRSTERRSFSANIQRTPVRSQSFENASTVANVDEDTLNFRDMFESSRQNLFGPRVDGSNESLNSRSSDSPLPVTRPSFQTGSDSGSGSSTPQNSASNNFASGLADAFSNIRSALIRSDSTGALRETRRSSSTTRETSAISNIQRTPVSNTTGNSLNRSSSLREARRESRFRRRTIQGVDSNVSRALEQERNQTGSPSISRSMSPLVMDAVSTTSSSALSGSTSVTQSRETTRTSFTSYSSAHSSRLPRKIDLYPDDSIPVLGFENEKEIFVDNQGKCHWLNKTHALIRELKSKKKLPEITIRPKLAVTDAENSDGFIAAMEGDEEVRYGKLRDLVVLAKKRDANFENGDVNDSARSLSLLELYQRGDFIEDIDIDDKYKSFSLYTEPRQRQNIESLISKKEVLSIYDGIPRSELPDEIKNLEDGGSEPEQNQGIRNFREIFSASQSTSRSVSDGATTRTEQSRSEASHEAILNESVNGNSSAMFARSAAFHEASETESNGNGNETSRHAQLHSRTQQAEIRHGDSVSNIFQRRAEARREQYLTSRGTSEIGSSVIQRRAEARRQQYLAEQQTHENGSVTSRSRAEDVQQRVSSETHTGQNGSAVERRSEERWQQYFTSRTDNSENGNSSVRHVEESSMIRQSSQSSIVRQSSLPPIDNSDIHSEVNLVMERLHMMQDNADMPLDTSHLDYEEMLMIQQALAENPSPPESPIAFESEHLNTEDIISVSDEENTRNQPEDGSSYATIIEEPPFDSNRKSSVEESSANNMTENITENIVTIEELPLNSDIAVSVSVSSTTNVTDSTVSIVRSSSDNIIDSDLASATDAIGSSFISARQSVITRTSVVDDLETGGDYIIGTKIDSIQAPSSEDIAVSDSSSSVKADVIEARTPRYQRLPSEGGECRLPLPSMDWSPLERSNSPLSPKRFSFEDKKSGNTSSASSTTSSDAAVSSKFTVPKTLSQTDSRPSVESELTIQIPSDNYTTSQTFQNEASSTVTQNLANQNDCNKTDTETVMSSASPLDKSRGTSVSSGSEAVSPSGSDIVTTVYEEFVHNIPLSVLQQMNADYND